jgi:hypothetical protein
MKKVIGLVLGLFVFLSVSMTSFAFASVDANGVSIFMTNNNSVVPTLSQTTFNFSETPYLYIGFPGSFSGLWKSDGSLWYNPEGLLKGFTAESVAGMDNWYTITNWSSVVKTGLWEVDAGYFGLGTGIYKEGNEKLFFNVVAAPEPISSALFLLGGGALALRTYRKRAAKKA